MVGHLIIKEWKERWTLAAFAVIVLAGFGFASLVFAGEREAPNILLGAISLVFFPVYGALLGATGFEAEFRNGAWTYLLSRPVKKTTVWTSKLLALFSILVLVGGVSFGIVLSSAKLKAAAATLTAPGLGGANGPLISMLVVGYGLSLLTLALAFAMSVLTDRAITVTAVSLFLGYAVYGGWLYGFSAVSDWLPNFRTNMIWIGLLLTMAVALFASFETFRKADFSQRRRKAGFFWRRAGLLFVPVLAGILVVAVWPPDSYASVSFACADAGQAYFNTHRGAYVYFPSEDRVEKLALRVAGRFLHLSLARGGQLTGYDVGRRGEALFMARTDGSGKVFLTGPRAKDPRLKNVRNSLRPILSPDGRKVAFSTRPRRGKPGTRMPPELWLLNQQGEVVKHAALAVPELSSQDKSQASIWLAGWPEGTNLVLFHLFFWGGNENTPSRVMAWDLDRDEIRLLALANPAVTNLADLVTTDQRMPVRRRSADGTGWTLAVLDVTTGSLSDVWTETNLLGKLAWASYRTAWSPDAQKLAFLVERDNRPSAVLGIYSWAEDNIMSRRELNRQDIGYTKLNWTADSRELVIWNSRRKGLEFFDGKLEPTRFVAYPEGKRFDGVEAVGDKLLATDWRDHRLWRLDLKTNEWKCVF